MKFTNLLKYVAIGVFIVGLLFLAFDRYKILTEAKNYRAYNSWPHYKRVLSPNFSRCVDLPHPPSSEYPFSLAGTNHMAHIAALVKDQTTEFYVINLMIETCWDLYYNDLPLEDFGIESKDQEFHFIHKRGFLTRLFHKVNRNLNDLPNNENDLDHSKFVEEEELIEAMGAKYIKFGLIQKRFALDWNFIEDLLAVFESIPKGAWVHFHCGNGKGRTTTIAILYDIFRNPERASAADFVRTHFCLGGEDIFNVKHYPQGTWNARELHARKALIETFHKYMNSPDGYPHKQWTQWLIDQNIPLQFQDGS